MKEHYLVSILSEPKKELLSILTSTLNRKLIEVESLQASKTHIDDHMLIHIEIVVNAMKLKHVLSKFRNVIEVYYVEALLLKDANYQKLAFYRIAPAGMNSFVYGMLQKFEATVSRHSQNEVIIHKAGREEELTQIYDLLEGDHLLSFHVCAATNMYIPQTDEYSSIILAA